MDPIKLLTFSGSIIDYLPQIWTFFLLNVRFFAFLIVVPGIGMGERGIMVRTPAILVFSAAAMSAGAVAAVPSNAGLMIASISSEFLIGSILGFIPMLLIAGVQTAMQLSSTTMGIGMGNLMDPTLGMQVSDLSRILGDIAVILFLMFDGHHVMLYAASGLAGEIVPGSFLLSENSLNMLIDRTSRVFEMGVILSAPVIVALFLTQFMMGLISKAVPSFNVFMNSFPLTIGIGLFLTILSMPDIKDVIIRDITGLENLAAIALRDAQRITP